MRLAIVVVTYNSAALLRDLTASLPAALTGVAPPTLVIVDNASSDGTLEEARRLTPEATLVQLGGNHGYAAGVNAGVAVARTDGDLPDAVLILNPDVRLGRGSVRALLDALRRPGAGITVPRLLSEDGSLLPSLRREPTVLRALGEALLGGQRAGRIPALGEMVVSPRHYTRATSADWATGAVMLVSRECLENVGEWDESFFLYSEETDFVLRARDKGFGLHFVPEATAVHFGGDGNVSPALRPLLCRNKIRLFRRRHGSLRTAAFATTVVIGEGARGLLGRSASRATVRALVRDSIATTRRSPA